MGFEPTRSKYIEKNAVGDINMMAIVNTLQIEILLYRSNALKHRSLNYSLKTTTNCDEFKFWLLHKMWHKITWLHCGTIKKYKTTTTKPYVKSLLYFLQHLSQRSNLRSYSIYEYLDIIKIACKN